MPLALPRHQRAPLPDGQLVEIVQRLVEGGLHIKGKTPLTSVATSLKRDKRFRKVGPNTFEATEDVLVHAV